MISINSLTSLSTFLSIAMALLVVGCITGLLVMYVTDITQSTHAIRRNYPILGRFRYLFETMGEFFRQYFFAMDREEMPFNRAQRNWVYRAAKNVDSTVPFGSTRGLNSPGSFIFVNTAFPTLDADAVESEALVIGPYCKTPWHHASIFNVSGMSFGAISKAAVQALANGAREAGCWINTGEGGITPWHIESGADIVVQIGTAKYGVADAHGNISAEKLASLASIENVRMFELKLSQGAKPGKGGMLPAAKVSEEVASFRGILPGVDSFSPNRHPDIADINALLDQVNWIRDITGKPTGFKLVLGNEDFIVSLCEAIQQRGIESAPDFITLDGADGGTGAAPQSLMDYVGLQLQESLPILANTLIKYNLKRRIRVVASGKLIEPGAVAWALSMGADYVSSARGFPFALGCIQALQCNKNTCPTGIATQNPRLQKGLDVPTKAHRVAQYCLNMNYEIGVIAHSCGVVEPRRLRRHHTRIIVREGHTIPLHEVFPEPDNASPISISETPPKQFAFETSAMRGPHETNTVNKVSSFL